MCVFCVRVYAENKKVVGSPSGMGPGGTVEGRMGDADGGPGVGCTGREMVVG